MEKKAGLYKIDNLALDNYHLLLNEALFHNGNGYIGIRSAFEEGYPDGYQSIRGQYINGFYDLVGVTPPEKLYGLITEKQVMVNVTDTQIIRLFIDQEEFSPFTGTVVAGSRWVDTDKGTTGRHVIWRSPQGKEIEITITRMTSFLHPSLFTIDYQVQLLNCSGTITFESHHNGNVTNYFDPLEPSDSEDIMYLNPTECQLQDDVSYITSITSKSDLRVCSCVRDVLSAEEQRHYVIENNSTICQMTTSAAAGNTVRLIKYAVYCDSLRCHDCRERAALEMELALSVTLDELYLHQEQYLDDYWENCLVEINGDDYLSLAVRYALFQLLQAVGKDRHSSVPAKGLSGERYEGHYFWDTEMYIQPFFTTTNPAISKKLFDYRYDTLYLAKENARMLGHKRGALFPWRTIMGKECSGYFPAGSAQYHINGAIAYAIVAYYLATRDTDFLLEKGAEILLETARLWMDVGNFQGEQFLINTVTGPDEYTCLVNNNYYTNVLAQYHLQWAVKIYYLLDDTDQFKQLREKMALKEEEIAGFQKAAESMYLPYDEALDLNPQDDSFLMKTRWDIASIPPDHFPLLLHYHPLHLYRHQICKQPDTILAHFLVEDAQPEKTMLNSFAYYEKITTHDSSLSSSIFCIMAARLGMLDKALTYFKTSAQLDLLDLRKTTQNGINAANLGGVYLALVYGFGGLRLKEDGISFAPTLPDNWQSYRFKVSFESTRIAAVIGRDSCTFSRELGAAKNISVYGIEYLLEDELTVYRS